MWCSLREIQVIAKCLWSKALPYTQISRGNWKCLLGFLRARGLIPCRISLTFLSVWGIFRDHSTPIKAECFSSSLSPTNCASNCACFDSQWLRFRWSVIHRVQATIRYIFVIYLLGLFSVISMFSNKIFFTVMICMLNKSCPDSLMVYTVKKRYKW